MGGVVYDYNENISGVVRITNVNDEQCSGEECYFPGSIIHQEHLALVSDISINTLY